MKRGRPAEQQQQEELEEIEDPFIGLGLPTTTADWVGGAPDGDEADGRSGSGQEEAEEDGEEGAAASTVPHEDGIRAVADANGAEDGVVDEASLPPWMRQAHASVIEARTPSTKSLGLDPRLVAALRRMGARRCFPVQAAVVPVVLAAHAARCASDMCVCAPTGSGKTLAYALPVVQSLLTRVVPRLRALVLLPTRGLAAQVHEVFRSLCVGTDVRVGLAAGQEGISFERERALLVSGDGPGTAGASPVDILIATPGRLVEHLQGGGGGGEGTGGLTVQHLRWLVIDEADRLLSQGYQGWLSIVLDAAHAPPPATGFTAGVTGGFTACLAAGSLGGTSQRPRLGSAAAVSRGRPLATPAQEAPLLKLLFSATLTRSPAKLAPLRLCRPRYFCVQGARCAPRAASLCCTTLGPLAHIHSMPRVHPPSWTLTRRDLTCTLVDFQLTRPDLTCTLVDLALTRPDLTCTLVDLALTRLDLTCTLMAWSACPVRGHHTHTPYGTRAFDTSIRTNMRRSNTRAGTRRLRRCKSGC